MKCDIAHKTPVSEQPADVRKRNFFEVCLGYNEEEALCEAQRCLNCKNRPCVSKCPVNVNIPSFIRLLAENRFEEAYEVITSTNSLPAVCGRVCPQEIQCESACVRGIKGEPVAIGRLERFAADYHLSHGQINASKRISNGIKVAVIGSGPAGLTCAGSLNDKGFDVTVFEALHVPGGVLSYGIPEFRLPKSVVNSEIKTLTDRGVKLLTNMVIGKVLTVDDLIDEGFKAIFIGSGAGLPNFMNIPGENLNGVYSANEYLTRINMMKAYLPESDTPVKRGRRVAVIGGGNVAMDAARCAVRMGADLVSVVYRRSEKELPARLEEVTHARQEGVDFRMLTAPVEILEGEKGFVGSIKFIKMELSESGADGRRRPVPIEGSEYVEEYDTVIVAIGTSPNPLIGRTTPGLEMTHSGCIVIDESTGLTSRESVYAGGDAVTGSATVILAMGAGRKAAESIEKALLG